MPKNYTAIIEVLVTERDERPEETVPAQRSSERRVTPDQRRSKIEVAKIIVKADTLAKLREKMRNHIALIEED